MHNNYVLILGHVQGESEKTDAFQIQISHESKYGLFLETGAIETQTSIIPCEI